MKQVITGACMLVLALHGCVKDELPVPVAHRSAIVGEACIGTDYAEQVWYDLGTNSAITSNSKMDHDLAFECGADGWRVRLNGARLMRAVVLSGVAFGDPIDTAGFSTQWRIDAASGHADSTAIGDWRVDHPVIVIDLGYAVSGLPIGLRQIRLLDVDAGGYTFEMAGSDGTGQQSFTMAKDAARSCVHFSLINAGPVIIAPPRGSYDLVFTQYAVRFIDPPLDYLVTGCLSGFSGARVAAITGEFASVTLDDTLAHPLTSAEDAIGYAWKEYDFDAGVYNVSPDKVYIVHDANGAYYKLHFIDFYNDAGERGCPKFEVVAL